MREWWGATGTALLLLASLVAIAMMLPLAQTGARADNRFYDALPYRDVFPLPAGPVAIDGVVRPIRIGFSQTGFNHPWRVEMVDSARAEVARHSNVELVVTDGKVDVVKQSGDIADLLAQGVDALVLSPVEDAGLRAAIRRAIARRHLPVIVLDRDVEATKTVFIGQSNASMAAAVTRVLIERLRQRHGQPAGTVLAVTGLLGSKPAMGRQEGFLSVVKEHPSVMVAAVGDGEWIREPAVRLMEDWLVRFPRIDAVFSHAEESSWGAEAAIVRAGRSGDGIMHFTHDGSNRGFCSVKSGLFEADGNYTPYIGHLGVRAALHALTGQPLPGVQPYEFGSRLLLPDLPVVTADNVDEWLGRGWGDWEPAACGLPPS